MNPVELAMANASIRVAALLSLLLPGLGQIYRGEKQRGFATAVTSLGVIVAIIGSAAGPELLRSWLGTVFFQIAYVFVWVPSVIDAYSLDAAAEESLLSVERPWYVIVMLMAAGPVALPLLWSSSRFSPTAKIIWTVVVVLALLVGILLLMLVAPMLERRLPEILEVLTRGG